MHLCAPPIVALLQAATATGPVAWAVDATGTAATAPAARTRARRLRMWELLIDRETDLPVHHRLAGDDPLALEFTQRAGSREPPHDAIAGRIADPRIRMPTGGRCS